MKRPFKLERNGRVESSFSTYTKAYQAYKRLRDAYLAQYTWHIRNADTEEIWEL